MADFDEYRKRWVYKCISCESEITAFRDCGAVTPCRCGGNYTLIDVIEPKHIKYEGKSYTAVHTFKPYFDVTLGKEVTSEREIKEYCAKNDCVYAGDKELTQQCEQNRREKAKKAEREFSENLTKELMGL